MKLFKRTVTLLLSLILISCLCTYFIGFYRTDKISPDLNKITELLTEHNIRIKDGILPKSYPDLPDITLKNAVHEKLSFAEHVLGKDFSVSDSKTYINDNIVLLIDSNEFTLSFLKEALLKKEFMLSKPDKYGTLIKKALSMFNFDEGRTKIMINTKDSYATVLNTEDNIPIFDLELKIMFSDNGISKITGAWFYPTTVKSYQKHLPLYSIIASICENPEFSGKTITDISLGYKPDLLSGYQHVIKAHPSWRITFDNEITYDYPM